MAILIVRPRAADRRGSGHVVRTARNDAGSYLTLASYIAHTGDYSLSRAPGSGAGGTRGPSAYFAPGYPYFLALVDVIDGHETRRGGAIHPARISQAVLGTITVALIGLVALELFGAIAGLIALVLAAIYPVLIELSATLVAENLLTALVLAAVYAGLRVRRARSARTTYAWVAGAGVLTGLATLTHENAIVIDASRCSRRVWTGRPRFEGSVAGGAGAADRRHRADDPALDDPQRRGHAPLHPGLRRDRDHAGRHLQRGLRGQPAAPVQVADLLRHPGRARPDPRGTHA